METNPNPVLRVPPAAPADALAYFTGLMAYSTDVSDVYAAGQNDDLGFTLVDTRGDAAWFQGRVPGALHLPTDEIAARAAALVDPARPVVVYCWGPGCNGAYRAAVEFAKLGYQVKYMMGGYEYWVREGLPVATDAGVERGKPDPLTAPSSGVSCAC
ncbi:MULTISPECIES: rhodanese-like domain-containing protein [Glycomyces]|uniref:Rhodanese-like domain-containing protein n=2 Tax=Glycomyces TaxID=58113 RepID=A0A9X3SVC6_9ACTN|nr:rhodanese-like domain-containing protein [Glycomyces lechevalierae]MDA1386505.1 rhodanese-like domain-containing protein [Glycomyces lechevalierae]MDA1388257.1 rhodanese-like domain-containing protein [Glycomyces lechevalierae]MDR7339022.1 rhodanese-related sulfurtransferase [Glycomyces lechevalierae]